MNIGHFSGNVGNVRFAQINGQSGPTSVLNFSLAVSKRQKGADGKPLTLWVDCALWGNRADALQQYIQKGTKISVCGEMDVETYQGANGVMPKLTCKVSELTLMNSRNEGQQQGGQQYQQQGGQQQQRQAPPPAAQQRQQAQAPAPMPPQQQDSFDDDIPF